MSSEHREPTEPQEPTEPHQAATGAASTADAGPSAAVAPTDPMMDRIAVAMTAAHSGRGAEAADLFTALWAEVGPAGDALYRMTIAHWTADLQSDPAVELRWDLRALAAAEELTAERLAQAGLPVNRAALFPSLHLNLGETYRKLGDLTQARRHLEQGLAAAGALGEDGYGRMIGNGLAALAGRLDTHVDPDRVPAVFTWPQTQQDAVGPR